MLQKSSRKAQTLRMFFLVRNFTQQKYSCNFLNSYYNSTFSHLLTPILIVFNLLFLFILCPYCTCIFHCIYLFLSMCLQFSDILLHTEPTGPSTYKFKNEMKLCSVKVELPKVSLVPFSFELLSINRSFILSARYVYVQ